VVAVTVALVVLVVAVTVPLHNHFKMLEFQALQILVIQAAVCQLRLLVLEEEAQALQAVLIPEEVLLLDQVEQDILGHSTETLMRVAEEEPSVHHSVMVTVYLEA
jgi:hypothetical protein